MTLPATLDYAIFTGRFLAWELDDLDDGDAPQGVPITDLTCTIRANIGGELRPMLRMPGEDVTLYPRAFELRTDGEGYLVNSRTGSRTTKMPGTDDADLEVTGWTYHAELRSDADGFVVGFDFAAPKGTVIDIARLVPVPASPGETTAAWLRAVADAQSAVVEAEAAALEASTSAADASAARDAALAVPTTTDSLVAGIFANGASAASIAVASKASAIVALFGKANARD